MNRFRTKMKKLGKVGHEKSGSDPSLFKHTVVSTGSSPAFVGVPSMSPKEHKRKAVSVSGLPAEIASPVHQVSDQQPYR